MKNFFYILIAGAWLSMAGSAVAEKTMSIQVETGKVRDKPSVFGKVILTVPYGEQLQIIETQGPWMLTQTSAGETGWVHESMLTRKAIELTAGDEDVSRAASGEELAMAGKGFNSQVEAEFKDKNKDIDFSEIDKMEKMVISDKEILEFLKEGGLDQ